MLHPPRFLVLPGLSLAMSCVGSVGPLPGDRDASSVLSFVAERRPEPPLSFFAERRPESNASPIDDAGIPDAGRLGDAGDPGTDAGVVVSDAGEVTDAGVVVSDAGEVRDAGVVVSDAGEVTDAGVVVSDAGVVADAGTAFDAGTCIPLQGTVTSLARGTYCVTGDVIIPTGVTLDIPAGTTFIVMGRHHIGRDPAIPDLEPPAIPGSGTIHAIGTAAEPIIFRGATPNTGWYGIVIAHSHDTVHLEYVTIRDTYKDDRDVNVRIWRRGGALNSYVNTHGTIIRHGTFVNNRAWSVGGAIDLNGHGVWPNQGPVEITNTLFVANSCECEAYAGTSIDLCGGGAIRFSHVGGDADLVKIRDNIFIGNEARDGTFSGFGGAIGGFDDVVIIGPGNVFVGNVAGSGDGAISCNHQPTVGSIIQAVDPSVLFINNAPENGCGQ